MIKHKKGDKLYLPSAYYLSHGEDDFEGGHATVNEFEINKYLPDGHYNKIMVSFDENPSAKYNYNYILENQEEWEKKYAGKIAHPSPDINTPWIQNGDIVDGKIWNKGDIW